MTSPRARVIGVGQVLAGDDGVGFHVTAALRARGVPPGVDVVDVADPSLLATLIEPGVPTVVVDALLAESPGRVVELQADELAKGEGGRVSVHGMSVTQALALARVVNRVDPHTVCIVSVTVSRAGCRGRGLSTEVEAAVSEAVSRVLTRIGIDDWNSRA